jgi:hypothetical protein
LLLLLLLLVAHLASHLIVFLKLCCCCCSIVQQQGAKTKSADAVKARGMRQVPSADRSSKQTSKQQHETVTADGDRHNRGQNNQSIWSDWIGGYHRNNNTTNTYQNILKFSQYLKSQIL